MPRKNRLCFTLSAFLGTLLLIAVIVTYSQYLTLKKTLIARISDRATSLVGQKVDIGDIFLSTAAGIIFRDIIIRNPEGFVQGTLLRIPQVHIGIRYRELFKGRFSFRGIEIMSPELTLITDNNGNTNISDVLMRFLSRKGTATYEVDALVIRDAQFAVNADPLLAIRNIKVTLNGLSSDPGAKTTVKASLVFLGGNTLTANGWVFLKDPAGRFSVDLASDMSDPSLFSRRLAPYGIDITTSRAHLAFHAEGDRDKGIKINTDADLRSTAFSIFRKTGRDLSLHADAFLDLAAGAATINSAVLRAGEASTVRMTASVHSLRQAPSYDAEIRIERLDLSALNIIKGATAGGIVTSDVIRLKGILAWTLPEVNGTVMIKGGSWEMEKTAMASVDGRLIFASHKQTSVQAEASTRIYKVGGLVFEKPATLHITLEGKGIPDNMALTSKLDFSDVDTALNTKHLIVKNAAISFGGRIKKGDVSGTIAAAAADMSYGGFILQDFSLQLGIDHNNGMTVLQGMKAASDRLQGAADAVVIAQQDSGKEYLIKGTNISAILPEQKAQLSGLDCMLSLRRKGNAFAGNLSFLLHRAAVRDLPIGMISGSGTFDDKKFSVDVPSAKLLAGTVALSARGAMRKSPLPADVEISAEHIDLGQASAALMSFIAAPYHARGVIDRLTFRGTVASAENITGAGTLKGRDFTVVDAKKRGIIKGARITAKALLRGKDMDVRADATIGNLSASLSGAISSFAISDRSMNLSITVPEATLNDIRTVFWDMFPDRLLYAGLEGSIALQLVATHGDNVTTAEGAVLLRNIMIEGENGEYAAGPLNGTLPVHYDSTAGREIPASFPSFERHDFDYIKKFFADEKQFIGNEIRIGSFRYGFRLLEDISFRIVQRGTTLNITHFSAKMFGGRIDGAAFVTLSPALSYRAGLIVDAVSLMQLCEDITPLRGYISGKVNGITALKGSGAGLTEIIGKADLWTYADKTERMVISKEFLEKIGGPQVRAYLRERRFDTGIMSAYLQQGYLIFRELEISNRNFLGMTDLSVKVAPLNNRISIKHLLWTIVEAAQRAEK